MSDLSELVASVTASENADRLIELTRYGGDLTATSVDTTVLNAIATEALAWFNDITTYDSTKPRHVLVARMRTLQLLWERTDNQEQVERIERRLAPLVARMRASRTVRSRTDTIYTRSEPTGVLRPPMDTKHFDGYRVTDSTNLPSTEFPDTESSGL